jgi:hypothetical protein
VFKETLRLMPPVWALGKYCTEHTRLVDHHIAPNVMPLYCSDSPSHVFLTVCRAIVCVCVVRLCACVCGRARLDSNDDGDLFAAPQPQVLGGAGQVCAVALRRPRQPAGVGLLLRPLLARPTQLPRQPLRTRTPRLHTIAHAPHRTRTTAHTAHDLIVNVFVDE